MDGNKNRRTGRESRQAKRTVISGHDDEPQRKLEEVILYGAEFLALLLQEGHPIHHHMPQGQQSFFAFGESIQQDRVSKGGLHWWDGEEVTT